MGKSYAFAPAATLRVHQIRGTVETSVIYAHLMYPFGRRQPPPDRPGIYLSQWWPRDRIVQIDDLADYWGLNRSQTIKRAIDDAHTTERKKGLKAKLRKKRG